ncbi:hypothetical protein DMJ13_26115 [halophilic archaeon]|nr:hypothetical protein DMJ13_26115 [halophilic archaeon]
MDFDAGLMVGSDGMLVLVRDAFGEQQKLMIETITIVYSSSGVSKSCTGSPAFILGMLSAAAPPSPAEMIASDFWSRIIDPTV